jgi:hypothetical protein
MELFLIKDNYNLHLKHYYFFIILINLVDKQKKIIFPSLILRLEHLQMFTNHVLCFIAIIREAWMEVQ